MYGDLNRQLEANQRQFQQAAAEAYERTQKIVDAAEITKSSTADIIAKKLFNSITEFQGALPDVNDVAIQVVQFGTANLIIVDSIGYIGVNLIFFCGKDEHGNPQKLIQHINQLNFLLMVVPKPNSEEPKRTIGFKAE